MIWPNTMNTKEEKRLDDITYKESKKVEEPQHKTLRLKSK